MDAETAKLLDDVLRHDPTKEEVVNVPVDTETAKLKEFLPDTKVAGVKFYRFAAGRKILLATTKNEFYQAAKHIDEYFKKHKLTVTDKSEDGKPKKRLKTYADVASAEFSALCEEAIPEFELHVGALAFICCHDPDALADATADPGGFRRAVVRWLDKFTVAQLTTVTTEALKRYADENIGNDFEVEGDEAPEHPN